MNKEDIFLTLEDIDTMVDSARNGNMVHFLNVVHSANIIRQALEKQIPQKAKFTPEGNIFGVYYCVSCKQIVSSNTNYCFNCGQKLDLD